MSLKTAEKKVELIHFHFEDVQFDFFLPKEKIVTWIFRTIEKENQKLVGLNFIFCSDPYLHQINLEYLNHDTFTDIITFPLSKQPKIEGDIFISYDRIKENANSFDVPIADELHRVIIHGVLHLCGYGDKTDEDALQMRTRENEALAML